MKRIGLALAAFAALVAVLAAGALGANSRSMLGGSTPPWARAGNQQSAADPSSWVNFRVYLSLHNQAQAESLAQAVSTPGSASFGKFLTPAQFNKQFAPTSADVQAVSSWLTSQGLAVDYTPSNNHYVAAEGTVAQVQAAFGTKLNEYLVNGVTLRGNATDLTVPSTLAPTVAGVIGVDQSNSLITPAGIAPDAGPPAGFRNARPCSSYWAQYTTQTTKVEGVKLPDYKGSATPFAPCGYGPQAIRQAYGLSQLPTAGQTGKGVTIAIIDAFAAPTIYEDAQQYFQNRGFPGFAAGQFSQVVAPGTYNHPEAGYFYDPQGWYGEETLDVEAAHSTAPGANIVYVGSPTNTQDMDAAMNYVVANRVADIVTNSYGFSGENVPQGYIRPFTDTLIQAATEGMSILFSSGDSGDETFGVPGANPSPDWPAVSPYVTAVGGTTLEAGTSLSNPGTYIGEAGWGTMRSRLNCQNTPFDITANNLFWCTSEKYLYGSGGGISQIFAEPSYQTAAIGDWGGRVVPDVAAIGDPNTGMLIGETQQFSTGSQYDEYRIGGTSLSSPIMAGMIATAEQLRGGALGLANPALYQLPASAYHDVVDTTPISVVRVDYYNGEDSSNGLLYSVRHSGATWTLSTTQGYDDVTGRGTPTASFYSALASWGK